MYFSTFFEHLMCSFFLQFCSHLKMILFIEEKTVGRWEWSWCPFVCFKGCWNHILQLCSPSTYYFLKFCCTSNQAFSRQHHRPQSLCSDFCLPFWYHMELCCRSGSKKFLYIYSGNAFRLVYPSLTQQKQHILTRMWPYS